MQFLNHLKIASEINIFLGWVLAIHLIEFVILPSLIVPAQLLPNYLLTERLINIWSSSSDTAHYFEREYPGFSARGGSSFGGQTGDESRIQRERKYHGL